jgi:hypothetical protein
MSLSRILIIATIVAEVVLATCSLAEVDRRQGFILGIGAGPGLLNSHITDEETHLGLQTDVKIGHGVTDKFLIHYTGKQFWSLESQFITVANPALGFTLYLKPQAPSFFLAAGHDFTVGMIEYGQHTDGGAFGGTSYHVGAGSEFAPHVNVELDVIPTLGPEDGMYNFALTLNVLHY